MICHRIRLPFFLPLLIAAFLPLPSHAQGDIPYNFSAITVEQGLAQNMVDDILMDSDGFVWIATWNGLERYDGYEFTLYNTRTPIALKSNFVRQLFEDSRRRLWIAGDAGLDILDLTTGALVPLDAAVIPGGELFTRPVEGVYLTPQTAWLLSGRRLYGVRLSPEGLPLRAAPVEMPVPGGVFTIREVNGEIWAGAGNAVCRILEAGGRFTAAPIPALSNLPEAIEVRSLHRDGTGVWIGTDYGLWFYDLGRGSLRRYMHSPVDPYSLSQSYITDIQKGPDGEIAVATLNGLNLYDRARDGFLRVISPGPDVPGALNCNFINCLYTGPGGILWIGTEKGGINRMIRRRLPVHNIQNSPTDPRSLPAGCVNALFEDSYRTLWVGMVEGGLNRRIGETDQFRRYVTSPSDPRSLSHNSVSFIVEDPSRSLWIGTWGGGVNRVKDPAPDRILFDRYSRATRPDLPSDYIASMSWDARNEGIWLGTPAGLCFFDPARDSFHPLRLEVPSRSETVVGATMIDRRGTLWAAVGDGICRVDLFSDPRRNQNKYEYYGGGNLADSLLSDRVNCIAEGYDGTIWLGSMGGGLYRVIQHRDNLRFVNYTTDAGISDNSIYGILEDAQGQLWLSTNNGLSQFDPATGRGRGYFRSDGLLGNQFYWNAYCSCTDGMLYFGAANGVVCLDARGLTPDTTRSRAVITRMRIMGQDVTPLSGSYITQTISQTSRVVIHERDRSFSLEFSALDYENPARTRYAYRLEGFDANWETVDATRRYAAYTNLPAGKYRFELRCTDPDGSWSDQTTSLQIVMRPYFYKTAWFLLPLILLALGAAYGFYAYRVRSLERHRNLLKKVVNERTHEIQLQKVSLEKQAVELNATLGNLMTEQDNVRRQNEALAFQNQKITRQKEEILTMTRKMQEMNLDKLAFFTNITHELRTPVTLIAGPIDRALKLTSDPKVAEQLTFAQKSAKSLLSLINQIMDFRKADTRNMKVTLVSTNVIDFLDSLLPSFEEYAGERSISIRKRYMLTDPVMLIDEENLQKVIANLLSNAIKFTPDNGEIKLIVSSIPASGDQPEKLCIVVRDTGPGIPPEDLDRVFERFYQSRTTEKFSLRGQSGTGIGLYLCKSIVQLHGGTIAASNNSTGGASLRIEVPLQRDPQVPLAAVHSAAPAPDASQPRTFDEQRPLVLVIEDNPDMRRYIASILEQSYNVVEAPDGRVGLEMLALYQPGVVVCDVMMPVMDGMEFCRRVKGDFSTSHIPVVLLTAKTSPETHAEGLNLGADLFITKPFDEKVLLAGIRNLLEKRAAKQERFLYGMDPSELGIPDQSQDKKFMDKVLEITKAHYTDPEFDVAQFIDLMGMSRSLLHKKLQNLTGETANRFIRIFRLNVARELIAATARDKSLNISEIAYQVGFNDPKYFTRCYTKQFGHPPSGAGTE